MKEILTIIGFAVLMFGRLQAQQSNWQNLDLAKDSMFGISTNKAYEELLKGKKANNVVVAVIDYGIDTNHEDLKPILWINKNEVASNGRDDDCNGYIDDRYGWNYLGLEQDKEDITYLTSLKRNFYDSLSFTKVPEAYIYEYRQNREMLNDYESHLRNAKKMLLQLQEYKGILDNIKKKIGKENPTVSDFKRYKSADNTETQILNCVINYLPIYGSFEKYEKNEIDNEAKLLQYHCEHGLNLYDNSSLDVDNDFKDLLNQRNGNDDVCGPFTLFPYPGPYHGTHVAGIIAAVRDNGIGIQGIADHVSIMSLRVLSYFRELRDKNLAKAIHYAVDNGAQIINLSFGKSYTRDKESIDEAVKYAMRKDVLIVHAAGNDGVNIDKERIYPSRVYLDGDSASAWIEVGASGPKDDSTLVAGFSNYGRTSVDVFAPGVGIYSTIPGSRYAYQDGTSMAAPVVAGLAALIREYYPKLTAVDVKEVINRSVVKVNHEVIVNGCKVPFERLCLSGGIVNAYKALELAATFK